MRTVTITSRDGVTIHLDESAQRRLLRRSKIMGEHDLTEMYGEMRIDLTGAN